MEKLGFRYTKLINAQKALDRAIVLYNKRYDTAEEAEQETYTASVIKHFELFYEMLWKFLKYYLLDQFGTDASGSKTIFRACYDQKLLSENELRQLLEVVEIRNTTAHVYDEQTARDICASIFIYSPVLQKFVQAIALQ